MQALDKSGHFGGRGFRSGAFNQLHNSAADYRGIGELRHPGDVFRVGDAEPHGYRQRGPSANAGYELGSVIGETGLRARDSHAGDGVYETL